MAALIERWPAGRAREIEQLVDDEREEALDLALAENAGEIGALVLKLESARARRAELVSGRLEVRRRRARNVLDAYIPPVQFYSIEDVEESNS